MNYFKSIIFYWIFLLISIQTLSAQNIFFYPTSDTIKVVDGCTSPIIICSLNSTTYSDSIIISPGFNTYMEYLNDIGQWLTIEKCYFLVPDTLNELDYEIWYYPKGLLPYFQQVPFDSSFYTFDELFELKLIVKSQGNHIDSLYQVFKTDYGLEIEENPHSFNISDDFELYPVYPNPFNAATSIKYFLPRSSFIRISIYDITGQLVHALINEKQNMGNHYVSWNAIEENSGVYFIVLDSEVCSKVQRCTLVK